VSRPFVRWRLDVSFEWLSVAPTTVIIIILGKYCRCSVASAIHWAVAAHRTIAVTAGVDLFEA